jgi:hypothetical protein
MENNAMSRTDELDAKKLFRRLLIAEGFWVQSLEPGLGSDDGLPDLLVMEKNNRIIPIEFKLVVPGTKKTFGFGFKFTCTDVKPSQFYWHNNFVSRQAKSLFCFADMRGGIVKAIWMTKTSPKFLLPGKQTIVDDLVFVAYDGKKIDVEGIRRALS